MTHRIEKSTIHLILKILLSRCLYVVLYDFATHNNGKKFNRDFMVPCLLSHFPSTPPSSLSNSKTPCSHPPRDRPLHCISSYLEIIAKHRLRFSTRGNVADIRPRSDWLKMECSSRSPSTASFVEDKQYQFLEAECSHKILIIRLQNFTCNTCSPLNSQAVESLIDANSIHPWLSRGEKHGKESDRVHRSCRRSQSQQVRVLGDLVERLLCCSAERQECKRRR